MKNQFILIVVVLMVVIAGGIGYYLYLQSDKQDDTTGLTENTTVNTAVNTPVNTAVNQGEPVISNSSPTYGLQPGESRVLTEEEKKKLDVGPELDVTVENQGGEVILMYTRPAAE